MQKDIDMVVDEAGHRGEFARIYQMTQASGKPILNLCVSDKHKGLLMNHEGFVTLLVDSLLLDPEHPRRDNDTIMGKTDWDAAKGPVQRVRPDHAACFAPESERMRAHSI